MTLDPFTIVYEELWRLVEAFPPFAGEVKVGNRINFAKETGRLGTSFDLTYGPGSGGGSGGRGAGHYGRGGY